MRDLHRGNTGFRPTLLEQSYQTLVVRGPRPMALSVVCWKWDTLYNYVYVNRLRSMLERHLHIPHQMYCFTDNPVGIDPRIRTLPIEDTFPGMISRSGYQANFRKLKTFDPALASMFGPRVLLLDLDIVITGDVTPVFSRTEPLLCYNEGWGCKDTGVRNTSVVLMDTGILRHMWTEFKADPAGVWEKAAVTGGKNNSDQAVFSYYTRDMNVVLLDGPSDGVFPFYLNWHDRLDYPLEYNIEGAFVPAPNGYGRYMGAKIPVGARLVVFWGLAKPAWLSVQRACPWVTECWQ
jgi:hypothetical protein